MGEITRWQHFEQVRKPQIEAEKKACVLSRADMRDRIAAALYWSRPGFRVDKELPKAWTYFELTTTGIKVYHREFADDFLIALDHLGLEIVDRNRE